MGVPYATTFINRQCLHSSVHYRQSGHLCVRSGAHQAQRSPAGRLHHFATASLAPLVTRPAWKSTWHAMLSSPAKQPTCSMSAAHSEATCSRHHRWRMLGRAVLRSASQVKLHSEVWLQYSSTMPTTCTQHGQGWEVSGWQRGGAGWWCGGVGWGWGIGGSKQAVRTGRRGLEVLKLNVHPC